MSMINNQREVRREFWAAVRRGEFGPEVTRRKIQDYSGDGTMYNASTGYAFCEWLDGEVRAGNVSERVAQGVTL